MPVKRRDAQALISILAILAILTIDQFSKALVRLKLGLGESIPIIRNILHFTHVRNTGSAFGLFKNSTLFFVLISVVAIIFISILILRSIKKRDFLSRPVFDSGLILIMSGALGNLIDRLRFGYVLDFIDFRIWPVFNIADSAITIGTFLLLLSFISSERQAWKIKSK